MDILSSSHPVSLSSKGLRGLLQRHALLGYFVMAYGFSWLAWLPYVLAQDGLGLLPVRLTQLGLLPGAYLGPLLSGLLMTAALEGKPGVARLLRRLLLWRVGWQWYLFALCGIPLISVAGLLALPGGMAAFHPVVSQFLLLFPLLLIAEILTSGLAEEPGWRGFALPRLQHRFGPLLGSSILGLLWGGWHLPLFLTNWSSSGASGLAIGEFILITIGFAIIITWVFNHTRGSLLIAILIHAALDASTSTAAGTGLFSMAWIQKNGYLALLIGFGLIALLLIAVTRGRLGYQRTSSPPDTVSAFNDGQA